jgi:hypothetical protein
MPRANAHFRAVLISQDGEEPSRRTHTEDADKNKTSKLLQKISRMQFVVELYASSGGQINPQYCKKSLCGLLVGSFTPGKMLAIYAMRSAAAI